MAAHLTGTLRDVPSELTVLSVIGRGAYGSVYKAMYNGKLTAVKAVPLEDDGDALSCDLQKEICMLKGCDSRWVVHYHGCLVKARTLWIAMELCDGGSVSDVLKKVHTDT